MNINCCDKCGKFVPKWNDVIELEIMYGAYDPMLLVVAQSRHLLPTTDCEGSPSRAQYITGNRDNRGYDFVPEHGDKVNAIHRQMVARFN